MADASLGTPEQLRDPNYTPPLVKAVPLGIQHVLAMFVSNVTPAIIVCGAAGFGFGSNSPDFPQMIYMIQMSMFFAGVATLFQTIGIGPVGARLPIVQGTSFAFMPIMIPLVAGKGVDAMAALMGGIMVGGLFHACLGLFIGKIRFALPPLVTGLVVMMIGLALVKVGIQYAAGGVPAIGTPEYGAPAELDRGRRGHRRHPGLKFFTRGMLSRLSRPDRPAGRLCRCLRHGHGQLRQRRPRGRPSRCPTRSTSASSSRSRPSSASA